MPGSWEDDIVQALRNLGGTARYADLYEEVKKVRNGPLPAAWQATVRRTIQSHSSDSRGFTRSGSERDTFFAVEGVGHGIWGLRAMAAPVPRSSEIPQNADTTEIIEAPQEFDATRTSAIGNENPRRVPTTTYRIVRDTDLARQVKLLHRGRCQVCGHTIKTPDGKNYAEAHHIIPLGGKHKGPDTFSNLLVLCPNHHAMMDMGLMELTPENLHHATGHDISPLSAAYHNTNIYRSIRLPE